MTRPGGSVWGFGAPKTAHATIRSFEVVRASPRRRSGAFHLARGAHGEARLIDRASGRGAGMLAGAVRLIGERLAPA